MRLAFIDSTGWSYTPDTPYERPLGGMQSAACYLAERLVANGHAVSMITGVTAPVRVRGIDVLPGTGEAIAGLAGADALIVVGGCTSSVAALLRRTAGAGRLILWTGHDTDQPAVANLAEPETLSCFDTFAMVSDWQKNRFIDVFGLPAGKCVVMRNAIAPAFENLFAPGEPVLAPRPWPPVLAYTSTPYRGLHVLVPSFPYIRQGLPGTTLKVFSSMAVYVDEQTPDQQFSALYEQARATEGVEYIGAVPQPRLARELKSVSCLAYPNTFPETSCIAVMEAMAAGCLIATCGRGALPETLSGYGVTLPPEADFNVFANNYIQMLLWLLPRLRDEPAAFEDRLRRQVDHMNATCTWTVRAREWEAFLTAPRP